MDQCAPKRERVFVDSVIVTRAKRDSSASAWIARDMVDWSVVDQTELTAIAASVFARMGGQDRAVTVVPQRTSVIRRITARVFALATEIANVGDVSVTLVSRETSVSPSQARTLPSVCSTSHVSSA